MSATERDDRVAAPEDPAGDRPDEGRRTDDDLAAAERGDDPLDRARRFLERIRTEPRPHGVALLLAAALGLVAAWLHWFGLVLAGAFVGAVAPSLRRAVGYALAVGLLVLVAFAITLGGSAGRFLEMGPVVALVAVAAVGLPVLGSLVRGLMYSNN